MSPSVPPLPPLEPSPTDFLHGLLLPFRAARLILGTPRLLALSLVSALVTLVTLVAVLWAASRFTAPIVDWALFPYEEARYGKIAWWALATVTFLLLLVLGVQTIPLIVLAPLQDPLSEATEKLVEGNDPPAFSLVRFLRGLRVSLAHNLSRVGLLYGGHLVLLLILVLPGIGPPIWSAAATAWTVFWLAVEYVGGAMVRHLHSFGSVVGLVRGRPLLSAGFGLAVYLWLWVPVVNLFFLPVAIVGGTLLFCGLGGSRASKPLGNALPG